MDALMKQCDAKDGVADGMISDPLGCDFDPEVLACKPGQTDACIAPEKIIAPSRKPSPDRRMRMAPRSIPASSTTLA